jgi:SagB-type dehydrogenase family enzyme
MSASLGTQLRWRHRLRRDARLGLDEPRPFVATQAAAVPLGSDAQRATAQALANDSWTELDLLAEVIGRHGEGAAFPVQLLLQKLRAGGWLEYELLCEDAVLAVLRPLGHAPIAVDGAAARPPVRLSRFALLRAVDGAMQLESPCSTAAVVLPDARAVALVAALAKPADGLDELCDGLPTEATHAVVGLLASAGMLADRDEDEDLRLAQWTLPDLLFHSANRAGRRAAGYGGTYRFEGRFAPLPAAAPRRSGPSVPLPVPDLAAVAAADPPLTTVIESRRSVRTHDADAPITLSQLGELLYRTCRTKHVAATEHDEIASRPYPAGGSLYELEVYPVVTACEGLEPGLWHYASADHALEWVREPSTAVRAIVSEARFASTMTADPQVLLVITARFGRVMWKYESIGYALVLKHVGVLYQTLYLVATAMGLAACAVGGGNSDRFAAVSGCDYFSEASVGEFLIGSRPEGVG